MSATLKTKQQFVELRANNESYEKIAKKLKVSKTTLIVWARECGTDIDNLRAITYEALQEQYKVGQQHRLEMWSEQLEAVRTELKTRGLADVPTLKLVELLETLSEKLKTEAYNIQFKSEEHKPDGMFDLMNAPVRDYWRG
jgi:transposase